MVMSTVKKLKECVLGYTGGGEMPQKALEEIRMTRGKPWEKPGNNASGRGNSTV